MCPSQSIPSGDAEARSETGPVRNILIVGGGTAGWMTAVYLKKTLRDRVRITLVESKAIGTVGVGEATFNTIKGFFDQVGLDEREWMPACNATYKMAISFVGWRAPHRPPFYHPFERYPLLDGLALPEWWLKCCRDIEPFDYACFSTSVLCDRKLSPKYLDGTVFDERTTYPYAYHFDAGLLASFLQRVGVERGVEHIYGEVRHVALSEQGSIESVHLDDVRRLSADLFIDCTGFRGLLLNQALGEPFLPFSRSLFCDSAIATRIPVDVRAEGINPYTTATAMRAGWVWNIPLFNRVGTGYVYARGFVEKEEAEREFRVHLGPKAETVEFFHIGMRVGRSRNSWVKNCISIGLSSGFVEPLESTGIFFIQHALVELVNHFPDRALDENVIASYNRTVAQCIDGIRDFLVLHYYASGRGDTDFWRAVKADLEVPEDLRQRLKVWKKRLPNPSNINPNYHGFAPYSYSVMLLGLGYEPEAPLPLLEHLETGHAQEVFALLKERTSVLAGTLPSHYEYLARLYGEKEAPSPAAQE